MDRQHHDKLTSSWIGKFKKRGPQCIGRGRKGLSTKIHLGLSPGFIYSACLSEGQRVDMKVFSKLWSTGDWEGVVYVIADKGYDYYEVRKGLRDTGKTPVIPRREGAVCPGVRDKERYQTRSNKDRKKAPLKYMKYDSSIFSNNAVLKGLYSHLNAFEELIESFNSVPNDLLFSFNSVFYTYIIIWKDSSISVVLIWFSDSN